MPGSVISFNIFFFAARVQYKNAFQQHVHPVLFLLSLTSSLSALTIALLSIVSYLLSALALFIYKASLFYFIFSTSLSLLPPVFFHNCYHGLSSPKSRGVFFFYLGEKIIKGLAHQHYLFFSLS